jgi:hypothetical protein
METDECPLVGEVADPDPKGLNVRSKPDGKIVDHVYRGAQVSVCEQRGDWLLIESA